MEKSTLAEPDMAVSDQIVIWPHPALTKVCGTVPEPFGAEWHTVVRHMKKLLLATRGGAGLAAPQVGLSYRLFLVGKVLPRAFFNPEVLETASTLWTVPERCLSLPGVKIDVTRPVWVVARWQGLDGRWRRERLDHPESRVFLHELDHINGKLLVTPGETR